LDSNELIQAARALFDAAPALAALAVLLTLVIAAVLFGANTGAARRFRASLNRLRDSLERSRELLEQTERDNRQIAEHAKSGGVLGIKAGAEAEYAISRVREARAGVEDALGILRAISGSNDNGDDI